MNPIKKQIVYTLIKIYNTKFKFLKIRKLIKFLIGNERISIDYQEIKLFTGVKSAIESSILFDEYNEKEILKLIRHFAILNYDFIDIGANVGVHSLTASKANQAIQVFSFEPEPNNFNNFMANVGLNKSLNIKPFCLGVGDTMETKVLHINSGWNKGRHSLKMKFDDNSEKVTIPIITLDTFKPYFSWSKMMLKIDVEGFESEVLKGAQNVLSTVNDCIIIIELLEESNDFQRCAAITMALQSFGFDSVFKMEGENKFVEVKDYQGSSDYIFIKGENTLNYFIKNSL